MKKNVSIAIIDDDTALASNLKDILEAEGYSVDAVNDGKAGIALFQEKMFDLALVDIKLPPVPGPELVNKLSRLRPETEYVMITAHATMETAIEAIRQKEIIGYENKPIDMDRLLTFIREVLRRRRAEEALRESEGKYRGLIEGLDEAIYRMSLPDGKYEYMSPAAKKIFGYSAEEFIENPVIIGKLMHPDFAEYFEEKWADLIEGKVPPTYKYKILDPEGNERWIVQSNTGIFDDSGNIIAIEGLSRDITKEVQAEETLRENEERYRSLVESTQDSIYVVNRNCTYLFMNKRHLARLNVPEDNAIGKTYREFHSASDTQEFIKKVEEVFASGAPLQHEHKSHRDGKHFLRALSPIIGPDDRTESVTVVSADITDRVQAEEERLKLQDKLHRAQKMEAMGLLAGGVAHDLNNILSGIVSYPELLLMDLPEDSPLRRPIKVIQESGMRAADVVEDLLTMARGVATGKETLNLNTIVTEYLESPESQTLEKTHSFVNLETELDPDLLNMSGSPIHIKKILMNLVINASEAIEGTGTVTISTMNRYLDDPLKGYTSIRTGEYSVLTVSDDGSGIIPKDLERIFEPFYTKKVMGRSGTGLGLAVVWNTVQDHNGYINVEGSEKGTIFELYFPVTRKDVSNEKEKTPLENYLGHGEKILVVDDEERQRVIACGILTKLGYNAEAVSSGEEAIEYLKEKQIDLIVLDMVMPKGINGRETYEEILKICPRQKAIIASGFSESEEVKLAQKSGAGNYIKKPYILEKIGLAVKEELEK